MKLFKWRKPKYKQITTVTQIKAHLREFILDSQISNAEQITKELGCPPISDELLEREEEESDRRVERISFLLPLLYGYSTLFSEAFVSTMAPEHGADTELGTKLAMEALTKAVQHAFEDAMSHLLIGSVSQMVDLGLLEVPKGK